MEEYEVNKCLASDGSSNELLMTNTRNQIKERQTKKTNGSCNER